MTVSYSTLNATATSGVKYGTASGLYDQSAMGSQASYWETFHHHVKLHALEPDTTYFYVAGDDAAGWSGEFSFESPLHAATSPDDAFSFAVFGDMGIHLGG